MKKKRAIRKKQRFFLLIEVLIALWIASMSLFFLIKPHIAIREADLAFIENLEMERLSKLAFIDLKKLLITKSTPTFDQLKEDFTGVLPVSYTSGNHSYECRYTLSKIGQKKKNKPPTLYLRLKADLYFSPTSNPTHENEAYSYQLIVGHREI